jgi:hypothetical protein
LQGEHDQRLAGIHSIGNTERFDQDWLVSGCDQLSSFLLSPTLIRAGRSEERQHLDQEIIRRPRQHPTAGTLILCTSQSAENLLCGLVHVQGLECRGQHHNAGLVLSFLRDDTRIGRDEFGITLWPRNVFVLHGSQLLSDFVPILARGDLLKNGFLCLNPIFHVMTVFATAPLVEGVRLCGHPVMEMSGGRFHC